MSAGVGDTLGQPLGAASSLWQESGKAPLFDPAYAGNCLRQTDTLGPGDAREALHGHTVFGTTSKPCAIRQDGVGGRGVPLSQ